MLPSARLSKPVLGTARTIVARLRHSVIVHTVHSGRVVAGRKRHNFGINPVNTEEIGGMGGTVGLPIEGEVQLGGTSRDKDIAIGVDAT